LGDALGVSRAPRVSDFAFQIGPALNAPGRIRVRQSSDLESSERGALDAQALVLPTAATPYANIAKRLMAANRDRKAREFRDFGHARTLLTQVSGARAIVIGSDVFDPGVVGLQASRLSEQTGKPAVVIAWDGNWGKGSVRSAGEVRVYEALERCREHLRHFGGHDAAGGLVIERRAFRDFSRAFSAEVERQAGPDKPQTIEADLVMTVGELQRGLDATYRALVPFGPYGNGNPWPAVFIPRARIRRVVPLGQEHCRVTLGDGSEGIEAYLWRASESPIPQWQGLTAKVVCRMGEYRSGRGEAPKASLEIQAALLERHGQ
jgi:single-stranded-DNA-specific exonuclease